MLDAKEAAQEVIKSVKDFIARSIEPLTIRIDEVSKAIPADPTEQILKAIDEAVKQLPPAKDGAPGKDAEPIDMAKVISEVVAQIPTPSDGKDGKDGRDADPELIRVEIAKAVEAIPKPKETPIEVVSALIAGEVAKAMSAMQRPSDGKDGEPGRDALQLDVLPMIDAAKSYPRGTFASHNGGLWRSYRNTDAGDDIQACGWQPIVEGSHEIEISQGDDLRTFTVRAVSSAGNATVKSFSLPVMLDRGVYKAESAYLPGDCVTYGGSIWIAQSETKDVPGFSGVWRLGVKKGRDGKDGELVQPKTPQLVKLK